MRFEYKNQNPQATSILVGKHGVHLKDLRRTLRRVGIENETV